MKMTALFLLLAMAVSSCKPVDDSSSGLSLVVGPNPSAVLPIDLPSCKQERTGTTSSPAVSKPSVEFGTFKFKWAGDNPIKISYIEVLFSHGSLQGGKFSCVIGSTELASMNPTFVGEIAGGAPDTSHDAECGIRCGPLPFNGNVTYAYIPGTVRVFGVSYDADNVGTPVVTETAIAVEKKF